MTLLDRRPVVVGVATFAAFVALSPDAVRNSITWYGFGVLAVAAIATAIAVLVHQRRVIRWRSVPLPLTAFLLLATVSIAWSQYRLESVGGVLLQFATTAVGLALALVLTPAELLRVLARVLRAVLALSLAFELVVALVVRHPVFPVWVQEADRVDPNPLLYWSRNVLFDDGKIQGITGSSTLLAMLALEALIVFSVQLAARTVRPVSGIAWVAVALLVVGLTRSATILLALAAVVAVLAAVLLLRRAATRRGRMLTSAAIAVVAVGALTVGILNRGAVLGALGKSDTLTGRIGIWEAVVGLAVERPVLGWGWISYWAPWTEPFEGLAFAGGMEQLHAHNAWLDVWLQLGVIGVVVFGALVATTLVRSVRVAVAVPVAIPVTAGPSPAASAASPRASVSPRASASPRAAVAYRTALVWPLLATALVVQSFAESRILVEGGWMLLVIVAVTAKRSAVEVTAPRVVAERMTA